MERVLLSGFTCYFDASGTQHDQLVLAVAGLMSTAEYWLEFEVAWKFRLLQSGLNYFHRKEIDPQKYPGLLDDLAHIIHAYSMRKFGMVVRVGALHRLVPEKEYTKWNLDAYSYAGRACAAQVRLWAEQEGLRSVPELVFATGDKGRNQLEARLRNDGFTGVRFQPAIDHRDNKTGFVIPAAVPLQAADLLAYELFGPTRVLEQTGRPPDDLSSAWFILDKIPGDPQLTSEQGLATFGDRIERFSTLIPSKQ
jgi:hypothetical protein